MFEFFDLFILNIIYSLHYSKDYIPLHKYTAIFSYLFTYQACEY